MTSSSKTKIFKSISKADDSWARTAKGVLVVHLSLYNTFRFAGMLTEYSSTFKCSSTYKIQWQYLHLTEIFQNKSSKSYCTFLNCFFLPWELLSTMKVSWGSLDSQASIKIEQPFPILKRKWWSRWAFTEKLSKSVNSSKGIYLNWGNGNLTDQGTVCIKFSHSSQRSRKCLLCERFQHKLRCMC